MFWKQLFGIKTLEMLQEEAAGEHRLRRVLGPVGLTSLGVGAIIGAGIFVMTGRVAANDAGPAILVSFCIAGIACAFAAFCYAEFSSMAPVAGSAYTYAYATLGELIAWIIGWDLILEYAMSAATVASAWSQYLNEFLRVVSNGQIEIPPYLCSDPYSTEGAWFNLPAILILGVCTTILVIGIRESAASNTIMVVVKLGVVLFVIAVGVFFIDPANWTSIPVAARRLPEEFLIPEFAKEIAKNEIKKARGELDVKKQAKLAKPRADELTREALARFLIENAESTGDAAFIERIRSLHAKNLPSDADRDVVEAIVARAKLPESKVQLARKRMGLLGHLGVADWLIAIDDHVRTPFMPYGMSGVIFGAAIVFFAFIGFDSISTHSEEAINPQKDLPFGILASLVLCTVLYLGVSAVLTGMVPYYEINTKAAVATAFSGHEGASPILKPAAALIAAGGLAGMTSVLLITFLSQARVFLAMARDGLLPHAIFGVVHEKFRTPARSTILTGVLMMFVAGFTPISTLEEMVNIGTLFAFVVVCASVMLLRFRRPEAPRPFRCPALYFVGTAGVLVNLVLMLFLPPETWLRLAVWLALGLAIYFGFGYRFSVLHRMGKNANT